MGAFNVYISGVTDGEFFPNTIFWNPTKVVATLWWFLRPSFINRLQTLSPYKKAHKIVQTIQPL